MNQLAKQFLLNPEITFLNHGAFGATPREVFEQYQYLQRELESNPVEFLAREFVGRMDAARESLAAYLGTVPEKVIFTTNTTLAINIIARSLNLSPGDEVLTTNHEYGAMMRVWRFLAEKRGFHLDICEIPAPLPSSDEIVELIWNRVNIRTRVIFLSHITSPTAVIIPLGEICHRAKEKDLLTVIDGAHAPGQIPLLLDDLEADFYVGNLHKWLCAPKGAGFLFASPEAQSLLEPLIVSWGWMSDSPGSSQFIDHHEWQGTRDPAAFLAVPSAIRFLESHPWYEDCHKLAVTFQQRINSKTQLPPISSSDQFAQMVAVFMPPLDPVEIQQRLYDEFQIEVPLFIWEEVPILRASFQGYNNAADLEALLSALDNLL